MPLNLRGQTKVRDFLLGVSYKAGDNGGKLLDARNVNTVQKRLDTRHGTSRLNAVALPGKVRSLSYFEKSDGSKFDIAMSGSSLWAVQENGAHTEIFAEIFTNGEKHRGITVNDRHIFAVYGESFSELYSFNGTVATRLGQSAPTTAPTVVAGTGQSLSASDYKVAYTFFASSIGFESNYKESAQVTVAANGKIDISNLDSSADNELVDKILIYLKDVSADGEYLLVDENGSGDGIPIGTTTFTITTNPLSSQTPPETNAAPQTGGGKFLTQFGTETVYAGRDGYLNEVYFSEPNLPDAYNDTGSQFVLVVPGDGGITGLATGLFSDSHLSPYLVVFKKKSIHIYSNLQGGVDTGNFVCINDKVGCVSHDTIILKDGDIYFLSEEGWRVISNGRLVASKGRVVTLADGDIDDIFRSPGHIYEVNRDFVDDTFSVYYPALNQYMTWVSEGINESFSKTYVFEFETMGFKPWEFAVPATCACVSKDSSGRDVVLMGTENGFIIRHSINENKRDVDSNNVEVAINASVIFPWGPDDADFDATYNYRELIVKSITAGTVAVKTFLNYNLGNIQSSEIEFTDSESGFVLDESLLDEGVFGDERSIKESRTDIHRVGTSIAFGFYQSALDGNMGLVSLQLDLSKNGNRNIPDSNESDEVFGSEEDQFQFTFTPSELQALIDAVSTRVTALEAMMGLGNQNVDGSWRCRLEGGQFVIQVRESGSWVTRYAIDPMVG